MFRQLKAELASCCDLLRKPLIADARCRTSASVVAVYIACDTPWEHQLNSKRKIKHMSLTTTLADIYNIVRLCNVFCCEDLGQRQFNDLLLSGLNRESEIQGNRNSLKMPSDLSFVSQQTVSRTRWFFSTVFFEYRIACLHSYLKGVPFQMLLAKVFVSDGIVNENVSDYLVCNRVYESASTSDNNDSLVWHKTLFTDFNDCVGNKFETENGSGVINPDKYKLKATRRTKNFDIVINGSKRFARIEMYHLIDVNNPKQHFRFCRLVTVN